MRDLIDDAAQAGFWSIRIYGGEPLLHKDLPKVVSYAIDRGVRPYVTTNGILLGEKIDSLYDAGLRDLTVGFYGTDTLYDTYVQRPHQFKRLEQSFESVRDKYGSEVNLRLNWLLSRPTCNQEALRSALQFATRFQAPMQVDLVHYSLPYFTEGPDRFLQFRPEDRPNIEQIVEELLRQKRLNPVILSQSEAGLRSITDWLIKGPDMKVPCDRYQMVWVGADGTVQLCYVTFKLGNLHESRFRDLLFTEQHRRAAQSCFKLDCPNCHCGYDTRILKDRQSYLGYRSGRDGQGDCVRRAPG